MARAITGSCTPMRSSRMGALGEQMVSPVPASLSPMATTMVPAPGALDALATVGVHREEARHLLVAPGARVLYLVPRPQHARVDAQVDRLASLVHGHLEGQGGEGGAVLGRAALLLLGAGHHALDRRHLQRRRQIVADGVEQRLDALVPQRRARQHRHDRARGGALAQGLFQRRRIDGLALEKGGGDGVVEVRRRLHQLLARRRRSLGQRRGDVVLARGIGLLAAEVQGLLVTRSTTPTKRSSAPMGSWMGHRAGAQAGADLLDHGGEVGAARSILLTKESRGTLK
jgi:hypothetical protein